MDIIVQNPDTITPEDILRAEIVIGNLLKKLSTYKKIYAKELSALDDISRNPFLLWR